jgi:murein L,D-transpeptidase YafK
MNRYLTAIFLVFIFLSFKPDSFKDDQLKYPRVRQAYKDKEASMNSLFSEHSLDKNNLRIYLRAYKDEKKIELWAKNSSDATYKLIKEYNICRTSGKTGPKRERGDRQIPEGFYHINRFNPYSNFYLSLGLNYPNRSDKILGVKNNLGGDIFIHGSCVTIGCLPIQDDPIKELYIICIEAKNSGQITIPVTIFPTELNDTNFNKIKRKYSDDSNKINLWADLKKGYDTFNKTKKLPSVGFLNSGRHNVSE